MTDLTQEVAGSIPVVVSTGASVVAGDGEWGLVPSQERTAGNATLTRGPRR
jgi:hypothetical protein